jgi:hypothetical protein
MLVYQRRWKVVGAVVLFGLLVAGLVVAFEPEFLRLQTDKWVISNSQRVDDWNFLLENTSLTTWLYGEGTGSLINGRPFIENTFLWALWKEGVVGVLFWLLPMLLCLHFYLRIPNRREHRVASAYFFGMVLVYAETLTNPYLNNPIGLSFAIISIFSLRTLAAQSQVDSQSSAAEPGAEFSAVAP